MLATSTKEWVLAGVLVVLAVAVCVVGWAGMSFTKPPVKRDDGAAPGGDRSETSP